MRRRSLFLVAPGIAVGIMLLLASLALAATFTLSGRVTDQTGSGIAGATIEALQPGTTTVVTNTTTGANGTYSLSLDAGTYDVRVTPPSGSGFQVLTVPNVAVNADRTLDVALVPAAAVTLSGRVLNEAGQGIPNQNVSLSPQGGQGLFATTDAAGRYSFSAAPGSYRLQVGAFNSTPVNAPQQYDISTNGATLSLAQDTRVCTQSDQIGGPEFAPPLV